VTTATTTTKPAARFLPWVDMLAEVGSPIIKQRDQAAALLAEADALERQADELRRAAVAARAPLLERVMKNWSLAELEQAANRAESITHPVPLHCIEDAELRNAIRALEGTQGPLDVLRLYNQKVIRQHNLLSTATEDERRATLARALNWWNFAVVAKRVRQGPE
jgi:hypothetical protein